MRKTSLVAVLVVAAFLASAIFAQPITPISTLETTEAPVILQTFAGYDSENITIVLQSPANGSRIVGTFNMTLSITSVNGPLNLTLYIEDEIYPDYNRTEIGTGIQNVTVDTTIISEGYLNFTLLFEDNSTGTNDKESYYLEFNIDNHGVPNVEFLGPAPLTNFTGLDDLYLNITADYSEVYLNVSVDGELTPEFNATLVAIGANNFTINGSRYENGHHDITVVVYTEEGLEDTAERTLYFLDYVRFYIRGFTQYDRIMGNAEIEVRVTTPYQNVTFSAYVDGALAPGVINITLPDGISSFTLNTTLYSEGEHNFTFIAYDGFGHIWERHWIFIVDNHGVPMIDIISPTNDVVIGYTAFVVNIETTWEDVTVRVYVDNIEITNYTHVSPGEFTFYIDTNIYSKWQHILKVVVETDEGESAEDETSFGFANMKIEEIASLGILIGAALLIPLYRKKDGQPIKPILILDLVYLVVLVGSFLILGVTTIPLLIWHANLASIWILGGILVFMNWVFPIITAESE